VKEHHLAWLSAHADRSIEWFSDRMCEGFDIHHLDGDHTNNDPANLVMIEHQDHMRLHTGGGDRLKAIRVARLKVAQSDKPESTQKRAAVAGAARKRARQQAVLDRIDRLDL